MSRITTTLTLLACLFISPLRADGVTGDTIQEIFAPNATLAAARPDIAVAPSGEALIVWVEQGTGGSLTLRYQVLDAAGNVAVAATTPNLPGGMTVFSARCGASNTGFMMVWEATGGADNTVRGIYCQTLNLQGIVTSGVVLCNTLTDRDESRPSVAGAVNGDFVVAWVRLEVVAGAGSDGVYVRRFTANATAIDVVEVRADNPTQNFGFQSASAVGVWPSGRIVVAWQDGPLDGTQVQPSPDGFGEGIYARWLDASLAPINSTNRIVNFSTNFDQFEPHIATDQGTTCVIGWCGETNSTTVDGYVRRFNDSGVQIDFFDINITPGNNTNQFLFSVSMTLNGDYAATWFDETMSVGFAGTRVGLVRFARNGTQIESFYIDQTMATEFHSTSVVGLDLFGNATCAWQRGVATPGGPGQTVNYRRFNRNMIGFSNNNPALGSTVFITLDSPSDPNGFYQLLCSSNLGPTPFDNRFANIGIDFIVNFILINGGAPVFNNFSGFLDASGLSIAPNLFVVPDPAVSGITLNFAFVTGNPAAPSSIANVSDTYPLTIQ